MKRTYIAPESSTVFFFSNTDFMGIGGSTGTGWGFGKEDGFDFEEEDGDKDVFDDSEEDLEDDKFDVTRWIKLRNVWD